MLADKLVTPFDWRIVTAIYARDRYDIEDHGNVAGGQAQGVTTNDTGEQPVGYWVPTGGEPVPVYNYPKEEIQQDDVTPGLPIDDGR